MEELKDIEIIDRYLTGALTDAEKKDVEQRLNTDAEFHRTFDEVKEAVLAVQLAGEDRVRAILKEEQAKMSTVHIVEMPKTTQKPFVLRGWLAAASIGLLVVVGYWFFNKNDSFAFNHKQNTWIKVERDASTFEEEQKRIIAQYGQIDGEKLLTGLKLYEAEQFDKAAPILLSINFKNDTLSLYQANALIKTQNGEQAISVLEKIPNNSSVNMEKDWYLAMAHWQKNEIANAKDILTTISNNSNHDWQSKAQDLLRKTPFSQ